MELRTTSFAFIRTTAVGAIGLGDVVEQQLDRHPTLLARHLLQRGEREHLGELVVVDADDAEIARHLHAESAGRDDRADRDLVARGDDAPSGRLARIAEHVDRRRIAAGQRHVRGDVAMRAPTSPASAIAADIRRVGADRPAPSAGRACRRGTRCGGGRARRGARSPGAPRGRRRSRRPWSPSLDPTTLTTGRPIATSRSTSSSSGSSPTAMSPSNRLAGEEVLEDPERPSVPGLRVVEGEVEAAFEQRPPGCPRAPPRRTSGSRYGMTTPMFCVRPVARLTALVDGT